MWWKDLDRSWSLFLDRDGVINERIMGGYVRSISEFKFLPGVEDSIAWFSEVFAHVFVVTNQQGVAKGIMTERNLDEVHRYMLEKIEQRGGKITRCYAATGLKSDDNQLRKPKPGMALMAQQDFPDVDFSKSIMVGDTDSDILFGKNLGMKTVRIKTVEPISVQADLTLNGLNELKEQWKS